MERKIIKNYDIIRLEDNVENELKRLIGENEKILYQGKPDKKCMILESIFNVLLPVAIVWAIIDFRIIGFSFAESKDFLVFIIPFMLIHLMPVWLYLGGIITSVKRYKNTEYIVTDSAVYISSGIFTKTLQHKPFAEMSHVDLHRGIFDQKCGVGDIIMTSSTFGPNNVSAPIVISNISNYEEVYKLVKKLQKDIYTDIMYPNDKRPKENHGYNTEYKG